MPQRLSFHLPDSWSWGLLVWLIVRLVLSIIGLVMWGLQVLPANSPYGDLYLGLSPIRAGWQGALLGVWQRWDAIHYMQIASFGYSDSGSLAYFPLFPVLSRLLSSFTGGNILLAMIIVSNVATIIAFVTLYQITQEISSVELAQLAVVALAVYPAAVYLYAPYAESLALCLVLVAYRAARHVRWKTALLAGIAAGLSQPIAIPAVVLLSWEVWQRRKQANIWALAAAIGPVIGAGAYFAWLKLGLNQSYLNVQSDWGHGLQWPWQALMNITELFRTGMILISGWINLLALILAAAAAIWSIKHLPRSTTLFQIAVLLMLLMTSHAAYPLGDFARHTLIVFPLFIALANWYKNSKHPILCLAASAAAFIYSSIMYFLWQ